MGSPKDSGDGTDVDTSVEVGEVGVARERRTSKPPPPPQPSARPTNRSIPPPVPPDRRKRPTQGMAAATPPPPPPPAQARTSALPLRATTVAAPATTDVFDTPTVVDRAIAAVAATTPGMRAKQLSAQIEAMAANDPTSAASLAYELGELYERRLSDEEHALEAYRHAFDLDPLLAPAAWALRRVLYRRQRWSDLVKLIDVEVARASDEDRVDLLLERARVLGHQGGAEAQARKSLEAALALAPRSQGVLLELERVLARLADVPAQLELYARLAEAVEQPERKLAYWLEMTSRATAAELDRALIVLDDAARLTLAAQLPPWAAERVARERLRLVESHGSAVQLGGALDELASALNRSVAVERGRQGELVALRRRQAKLVRAEMPINAWDYLQQALELAPNEPVILVDLIELASELGRFRELGDLLRVVEGDAGPMTMLTFLCAEAHLRPERRKPIRTLIKALEPSTPGALLLASTIECEALAEPSREAARLDLANAYVRCADAMMAGTWLGPGATATPEPAAAAALYLQAAELLTAYVRTPPALEQAGLALEKALGAASDDPAVLEACIDFADATGDTDGALDLLRQMAIEARGDRAIVERAIRLAYGHRRPEAVLELERDLVTLHPDDAMLAWRLEAALAAAGQHAERAELLVRIARTDPDPARKRTALLWAAQLHVRTGAVAVATDLYRQLRALSPDEAFVRDALSSLLRSQGLWPELASLRRAEARALAAAEEASAEAAARRAWREAAWVLEVHLEDLDQAAAAYAEWLARLPTDRSALEGAARCRARLRDHAGELVARAAIVELDQSTDARWLYARSLERAERLDEATAQYRLVIEAEDAAVAATSATLALADLATRTASGAIRVEAAEALAKRTTDLRLAGALFEDCGWTCASVLDDAERASEAFEAALTGAPDRGGAMLGLLLAAARKADPPRLIDAYARLAAYLEPPDREERVDAPAAREVTVALALRAAAVAASAGNLDVADARIAAARGYEPIDDYTVIVASETSVAPLADETDPFAAEDKLLARAELCAKRAALTEDATARAAWELDRAVAFELAGQLREAGNALAPILRASPTDRRALSALRRVARRAGDRETLAQTSFALAQRSRNPKAVLALLREAVEIYDGPRPTGHVGYACGIYRKILETDPGAPEFERYITILRERGDARDLVDALTGRLTWLGATKPDEGDPMLPLLLERSTLLHGLGRQEQAIVDLDALLDYAPEHVDALRLRADLANEAGDIDRAVALWWRYLAVEPAHARRMEIEAMLERALASDVGVAPPPTPTAMPVVPGDETNASGPGRTGTRRGLVAQTGETQQINARATKRGPAIIRRTPATGTPTKTNVMPTTAPATSEETELSENTVRSDLSALQEAERAEAQASAFGGNTPRADLSALQEEERRASRPQPVEEPTGVAPRSTRKGPAIIRRPATVTVTATNTEQIMRGIAADTTGPIPRASQPRDPEAEFELDLGDSEPPQAPSSGRAPSVSPRHAEQIEVPNIDVTGSSAMAAAVGASTEMVAPRLTPSKPLAAPALDLGGMARGPTPIALPPFDPDGLVVPENLAGSSDDSAVVMLSLQELQPPKQDDALGPVLAQCEEELAVADDVAVRIQAGRTAELLGRIDQARKHYDAAIALDATSRIALSGLRRIARAEGDLVEVTRLLEAELAGAGARERRALQRYLVDVLLARHEHDRARETLGELIGGGAADLGILLAQLELAFVTGRDDELEDTLAALAALTPDPALRAAIHAIRAARAERRGEREQAASAYAAAAEQEPGSATLLLAAIRQAVASGDGEAAGAALLELAYHVEGEDPSTAAALAVRAQVAVQSAHVSDAGRETASAAAQLASRVAARDPLVARIATESAHVANDNTIAIHAYARWVRCKSAPAERAYAAARAAELEPAKFGRLWAQVLELDPGDDYATSRVRAGYMAIADIQAAIDLDLRVAADSESELPWLAAAAELVDDGQLPVAIETLTRAREGRPGSALIADALAELLARSEQWAACAKLYGELAAAPGMLAADVAQARCARAWSRAAIALSDAGSPEELELAAMAALDAWDVARAADPTSPVLHASTLALTAMLADQELLTEALAHAHAAERWPWAAASLALQRASLLLDSDPRLAIDIAREASGTHDDPRRVVAVMMAAAHRRDLSDAITVLEDRASAIESGKAGKRSNEPAMLRLRAAQLALDAQDVPRATRLLARVDATWPGVAELAEVARRRAGGPTSKAASFLRVLRDADSAAERDDPSALVLYQRALELRPGDALAAVPLVQLATRLRQPAALTKLVGDQLRAAQPGSELGVRIDAHELAAHVERLRGDAAKAQRALEAAAQVDPSRLDLLVRTERELAVAGRHKELLAVRERELALVHAWITEAAQADRPVDGKADLAALLMDAATLAVRDKRPDADLAALYAAAIEAEPQQRLALVLLEANLRRAGSSEALAQLQQRISGAFADERTRAALLVRAGETLAAMGRPVDAVMRFAAAAEACADYAPAVDAWHDTAIASEQWLEVARAAAQRALLGNDPHAIAAQHHYAGVVLMDKAHATQPAIAAFRAALQLDPGTSAEGHNDTFVRLGALYEREGQREELAALLRMRLEVERDPAQQVELHRTLGEVAAHAGDRKTALVHYRAILPIAPADVRAHAAIADLVTDPQSWQEAAAAVTARIPLEKDPKILRTLHYRLGLIWAEHDVPQALAAFQRAASLRPGDAEVLLKITDLAIRAAEWTIAIEACEQLVTTERDPDKLAAYLHRAATIFARGFGDQERTERMLNLALDSAPTNVESLRLLLQFYRETANTTGLRAAMSRVAGAMRSRIAQDPVDGLAYRTLARASSARGEPSVLPIARAAAELAQLLGAGEEPEQRLIGTQLAELALLDPAADDILFAGAVQPELRHVFRLLGEPIAKHVGIDLNVYGVTKKQRLRSAEPAAAAARDVALALGFNDVEVYVTTRRQYAMVAEPTHPVSLVLGSAIAASDARDVRFAAGAALKLAQMSLSIPARLPPEELVTLAAAILRVFQPDLTVPGMNVDEVNAATAKLRKLIPASLVNEVRPYALRVPTFDHVAFAHGLTIAGLRAGWAASGSLLSGLTILAGAANASVPSVLAHPITQGLVSYVLSEDHLTAAR